MNNKTGAKAGRKRLFFNKAETERFISGFAGAAAIYRQRHANAG
jgi:hypothetical protein